MVHHKEKRVYQKPLGPKVNLTVESISIIHSFHLDLFNQTTTTILTSTLLSSTVVPWQPGQLKNCTDPGKKEAKRVLLIDICYLYVAIDEFPDDLFSQSQRRHVSEQ